MSSGRVLLAQVKKPARGVAVENMAGAAKALSMDPYWAATLAQRVVDVLALSPDLDAEDFIRGVLDRYRNAVGAELPPSSYDAAIAAAMATEWLLAIA